MPVFFSAEAFRRSARVTQRSSGRAIAILDKVLRPR
jgi:hypothetical protein